MMARSRAGLCCPATLLLIHQTERPSMLRWALAIFVTLIVFSALLPWLEKLGVGRLPGDFRFTVFGKKIFLPFASTVLLSLLAVLIGQLLR